jgi:benzoate-CoA ligase family protein
MSGYNASAWLVDRHVADGDGGRVAFRFRGASITYADLQHATVNRQQDLVALGLQPGDRVGMVVVDEPAFVSWFLGAMRGGLIPVPLSTMLKPADIASVVSDSGAAAIVLSAQFAGFADAIRAAAPCVQHVVVLSEGNDVASSLAINPEDTVVVPPVEPAATTANSPAFWLYSSGTTGLPKGVMHRHGSLQATGETYARSVLNMTPDDRVLSIAKLFFAFGLGNSLTFPLAFGASTVLHPEPPNPAAIAQLLADEQPTLFFASPGFVAAMLDAQVPIEAMSSVRITVTAGEALPADLARRFAERYDVTVLDGLGTTEALHIFLSNHAESIQYGTSGTVVDGYEVELRNDAGEVVLEADAPGYLHVRGPSLADGYWQREQATVDAFIDGWLRTGDVYQRTEDGFYKFLGRNNDMIKAGGIWVSPAEVESVLIEHPDVLEAGVVGARNAEGLETTVAFVVPRSGCTIDPASIEAHCRDRMATFKRPRQVIVVDALPKTATGKVQRFALRKQLET